MVRGAVAVHLCRYGTDPHDEGNGMPPRYYSLDMTCLVKNLLGTAEYQGGGG